MPRIKIEDLPDKLEINESKKEIIFGAFPLIGKTSKLMHKSPIPLPDPPEPIIVGPQIRRWSSVDPVCLCGSCDSCESCGGGTRG